MEGSDDIICPRFSISMGGKALFKDARLALIHGHRYGLIGPNGCGKSTLMHAIGYGTCEEIKKAIPPNTDILLVEQEVAASDEITALQMVVAADTRRTALLAEARTLERLTDASESSELREQAEGAGLDAICLAFSRASSSLLLAVSAAAKASRTRTSSSLDTTRSIAAW